MMGFGAIRYMVTSLHELASTIQRFNDSTERTHFLLVNLRGSG